MTIFVGLGVPRASAQLPAGEIFAIDSRAGIDLRGALFRVNPTTGQRTLVSDFGDAAQGPVGRDPFALAFDSTDIVVLDQTAGTDCRGFGFGCGALFRVDPITGTRQLLSDFGNPAQGPTGLKLYGITTRSDGDFLVTDQDAGIPGLNRGKLFVVDGANGTRTILSDFENPAQGPLGGNPSGVVIDSTGRVLVTDPATDPFPTGVLFAIDGTTGVRTILSTFTNGAQGPGGQVPIDVEPASVTDLWVLDQLAFTSGGPGLGKLFRVVASTGLRTVVSDFSTTTQGPIGFNLNDIKIAANGSLLIIDFDAGTDNRGALFSVNPTTGQRFFLSDFGNPAQGPLGVEPSGIALAPAAPPPPPPPPGEARLVVKKKGSGNGSVSSVPAGIACGLDCTELFPSNQVVTLIATPDSTSTFGGWSGDPDCVDGSVQMTASRLCTATFDKQFGTTRSPNLTWVKKDTNLPTDVIYETVLPFSPSFGNSITNNGLVDAPGFLVQYYFSSDGHLGPEDRLLGSQTFGPLAVGQLRNVVTTTGGTIPAGTPVGRYFIFGVIDPLNQIGETNEQDNVIKLKFDICPVGDLRCIK